MDEVRHAEAICKTADTMEAHSKTWLRPARLDNMGAVVSRQASKSG